MSGYPEQPFDAREERYFLAEILKVSPVEPNAILDFIQRYRVQPQWEDIALPNGRSVSACRSAFNRLLAPSGSQQHHQHQPSSQQQHPPQAVQHQAGPFHMSSQYEHIAPAPAPAKRAFSDVGLPAQERLQPQYPSGVPTFAPVNVPQGSYTNPSRVPPSSDPESAGRKKRGRPTKAEAEQKAQEAAEKGQTYPKPKKPKTPRASLEAGPLGATSPEATNPEGTPTASGTIRQRSKKPRIDDPSSATMMGSSPQLDTGSVHRAAGTSFIPITETQQKVAGPQSSFMAIQQPAFQQTPLPSPARTEPPSASHLRAIEPHPVEPRPMEQRILPPPPHQTVHPPQMSPRPPDLPVTTSVTTISTPTT